MADPDFRQSRLRSLRLQLDPLTRKAMAAPVDSPLRASLNMQLIEAMLAVVALRQELRG
jgi:mannose/cellobiose epimerase-like protein (N-acyl-D-glucosamine 2-epimerase family)